MAEFLVALGQVAPDIEKSQFFGAAVGLRHMGIISETGIGHQRTAGHEHIILDIHRNARVRTIQFGLDPVHRVAGIVHLQVIHRTAVLEVYSLFLQPDHDGLDNGVVLIALGVQDALQVIDAVGKTKPRQIPFGFPGIVVRLEGQHGMEAPPHG